MGGGQYQLLAFSTTQTLLTNHKLKPPFSYIVRTIMVNRAVLEYCYSTIDLMFRSRSNGISPTMVNLWPWPLSLMDKVGVEVQF